MNLIVPDFETFYGDDYTLSKMTTESYVRGKRFETIGVGLIAPSGKRVWLEHEQFSRFAARTDWSKYAVLCHHAHFDGLILSHHYNARPGFWFDTLSMSRALHGEGGNSLAKLAERYGVGMKGNEVLNAKGKRRQDFTPEEWRRYGEYCLNDCELTLKLFQHMVKGFPQSELKLIDLTVRMFTEPVLTLDEPLAQQFLADEQKRKEALLTQCGADRGVLTSNNKFAELLFERGIEPPKKISPRTGEETYAFAKSDPGMQELLEHDNDEIRWLVEARLSVRSTINESRTARLLKLGQGGRPMPVYSKYYGAHTGRSSGGDKVNWKNFTRGSAMRKAIVAPKGYKVVRADASQIEARTLAWLSGQNDLVQAFAEGRDVYSEFASVAYRRPIDRRREEDKIPGFVGKTCVLGLGYGMGWYKFAQTLLAGSMGGPPVVFNGGDVDALKVDPDLFWSARLRRAVTMPSRLELTDRLTHCAVAATIVDTYRAKNSMIVRLWKFLDETILPEVLRGEKHSFGYLGCVRTDKNSIVLPNGMSLRYPELARDEKEGYTYRNGRKDTKTYGAKLAENLIQALARIVTMGHMLEISKRYKVVTETYDEIVCVVPEGEAEEALRFILGVMKTPPAWAHGLPLAAEGKIGQSYGTAEKVMVSN